MYQQDDPIVLHQQLTTLKEENYSLIMELETTEAEVMTIQDEMAALEMKVHALEGEVKLASRLQSCSKRMLMQRNVYQLNSSVVRSKMQFGVLKTLCHRALLKI